MRTGDIDLSRVVVAGQTTTRQLVEALALYREIDVIVDHGNGLRQLVNLFTPQGFASFLSEFGATFRVWVQPEHLSTTWRPDDQIDLNVEAYSTRYPTMYDRMKLERGLPFWGPTWEESIWCGPGAEETVEAIRQIPAFPGSFVYKLSMDLPHLVTAFEQFLREDGIEGRAFIDLGNPITEDYNTTYAGLRVHWEGEENPREASGKFMDFLWAASDAYAATVVDENAHLVMPDRSATMVGRDAVSLVRRMTHPQAVSDIFREVVLDEIPVVPDYFKSAEEDPHFLDDLKRCREARLKIGLDVPDLDIITRLQPWALGSRGPAKMLRWGLFLGGGLILDSTVTQGLGTATGVGLSIFDAFLLDSLTKRWRPNLLISDFQRSYVHLLSSQLDQG